MQLTCMSSWSLESISSVPRLGHLCWILNLTNMAKEEEPVHTVEWRCHKCRDIWWEWKKSAPTEQKGIITFNHHESFAALEESAAAGCSLCASFRASTIYHDAYPKDRNSGPIVLEVLKSSLSPHITFKIGKSEHYESFEFAKLQNGVPSGIKGSRLPAKRNCLLLYAIPSSG